MNWIEAEFRKIFNSRKENLIKQWSAILGYCYSEADRQYHNIRHIENMWKTFESLNNQSFKEYDRQSILFAILFHDIVYQPQKKNNEIESVKRFKLFCAQMSVDEALCDRVCKMILSTIDHIPVTPNDELLLLFLDLDLQVLAMPETEYLQYAKGIRHEYLAVEWEKYRQGRSQVLKSFLDRGSLFRSKYMQPQLELDARRNMETELAMLENAQSDCFAINEEETEGKKHPDQDLIDVPNKTAVILSE